MEKARIGRNGRLVTVEQFIQHAGPNYHEKKILPHCPACKAVVEVYGAHSLKVTARFDHPNMPPDANPLDDCILANRGDVRFKGLEPSDWDEERAYDIRRSFFMDDNIKVAYSFCLQLCRPRNLPTVVWREIINRADRRNIWAYKDIEIWVIPYILLSLGNFTDNRKNSVYNFHFLLRKPRGSNADALWIQPEQCSIVKVFSRSGEEVISSDNPFPVSQRDMEEKSGDVKWITPALIRALRG